jgi:predicted amidohydrolase YtcJ
MEIRKRIPLLKDHHTHPYLYAALANCLDISSVVDKSEALSLISDRFGDEELVVVTGWYDCYFEFEQGELDALPPLIVFNISLHRMTMNAAARERLARSFPLVVKYYRDSGWAERNAPLMLNFLITVKCVGAEQLRSYFAGLARLGVWHAEEMSLKDEREIELFRKAGLTDRTRFWTNLDTFGTLDGCAAQFVHGIKLFADGAVGARSARLKERYLNGEEGVFVYREEELLELVLSASLTGKALSVHAIGNAAIDQVVRVLERVSGSRHRFPEIRMEHCQFISRQAAGKAKAMAIKLCMQPNFSLDSTCYSDRLSDTYRRRNNPVRMLIDEVGYIPGKDMLFGSDGMPHGVRPALESALFPPFDGQKLTLEEFVAGYCVSDFLNGHIDVCVDYEGRAVEVEVVLTGKGE